MRKALLVGEAPGRSGEGAPAFSGHRGSAGRLERLLGIADVRAAFDAVNLLESWPGANPSKGSAFDLPAARAAAAAMRRLLGRRDVLLAGRRVAAAFGLAELPYLVWRPLGRGRVAVLPHPSGVNRWWNDAENGERARAFLAPLLPSS